jgi:hypothetical protein
MEGYLNDIKNSSQQIYEYRHKTMNNEKTIENFSKNFRGINLDLTDNFSQLN